MVNVTGHIRQRPALTRLAMTLTRFWRDLMARHDRWPAWARSLLAPLVRKVEQAYEYASTVSAAESLGTFSGYQLLRFDGLVFAIPAWLAHLEASRRLASHHDVLVATTPDAVKRKISRTITACTARHVLPDLGN